MIVEITQNMIECEGIDFSFEERLEPEIEEKFELGDKLDR